MIRLLSRVAILLCCSCASAGVEKDDPCQFFPDSAPMVVDLLADNSHHIASCVRSGIRTGRFVSTCYPAGGSTGTVVYADTSDRLRDPTNVREVRTDCDFFYIVVGADGAPVYLDVAGMFLNPTLLEGE